MTVDKFLTRVHLMQTRIFHSISEPFRNAPQRQKKRKYFVLDTYTKCNGQGIFLEWFFACK